MSDSKTAPTTGTESSGERRPDPVVFRGSERWTISLSVIGMLVIAVSIFATAATLGPGDELWETTHPGERELTRWTAHGMAAVLVFMAFVGVFRTVRDWRRPYIRFHADTLIVHRTLDRPMYLPRHLIRNWRAKTWSTVLTMEDGARVRISHSPFVNSAEVARFHIWLGSFLDRIG